MSGIAGIIRFDGGPVAPGLIERMTTAMAFRGPDGIGHWKGDAVALGHCMLRTTPESHEETQPLANEDEGVVLVMDGWLSNWAELRSELMGRGARLRTRADAELVLRAYETWGEDCLDHIDGDFALVVWDKRRRTAFCARDHIGNKPFYYHHDGKTLVFASEIRAVVAALADQPRLNLGMASEFLACHWISRDETFWKGVSRLVAAHAMAVEADGPRIHRYWQPDPDRVKPSLREDEWAEQYRELLFDEVKRASRSSGPLACEVSGGLDSSAIFAVADALSRRGELPAPSLAGYTLLFDDNSEANELAYARAVGSHVGRKIEEIPPTVPNLGTSRAHAKHFLCFPSYPNGTMSNGLRAAASSRGSRVLLVGIGGDEWLGGSRSYYTDAVADGDWWPMGRAIIADAGSVGWWTSLSWALRHGFYPLVPRSIRMQARRLLGRPLAGRDYSGWLAREMKSCLEGQLPKLQPPTLKTRRRVQCGELQDILDEAYSTHARELEDQLAALQGIELRKPMYGARQISAPPGDDGAAAGEGSPEAGQGLFHGGIHAAHDRT